MRRTSVALLLLLAGCPKRAEPPPPPVVVESVHALAPTVLAATTRVEPPLDPVRADTARANREALATMARSIRCPQRLPSDFAKFCAVADAFDHGTAPEIPEGAALLLAGEIATIQPGPPSVATLGTSTPVVLVLRRSGPRVLVKQYVLRDPGIRDAIETALGRIGGALDGRWDHVDLPAAFTSQLAPLANAPLDPLERSGDSYWPVDRDGFELRRAGDHWMAIGAPEGPAGRHFVSVYVDHVKVLTPSERSPQTVHVLHIK
jgi:hypothetical protein